MVGDNSVFSSRVDRAAVGGARNDRNFVFPPDVNGRDITDATVDRRGGVGAYGLQLL